jgi:hypothetical protein
MGGREGPALCLHQLLLGFLACPRPPDAVNDARKLPTHVYGRRCFQYGQWRFGRSRRVSRGKMADDQSREQLMEMEPVRSHGREARPDLRPHAPGSQPADVDSARLLVNQARDSLRRALRRRGDRWGCFFG